MFRRTACAPQIWTLRRREGGEDLLKQFLDLPDARRTNFPNSQCVLIDRLRFRPRENLLETRIASQRIPFPPQTKLSQRDAIRPIRVMDCARGRKKTFDERDRLVRLA